MNDIPTWLSERLIFRKFFPEEAALLSNLAGDYAIAHGCMTIPHPYGIELAEAWITCHEEWYSKGSRLIWAIVRKEDGGLIGGISLIFDQDHKRAEVGYWIGVPYWGYGYATEAAGAAMDYAFDELMMNRTTATTFVWNQASERVLEKIGMQREGILRRHLLKEGIYEDVRIYGLLNEEWREKRKNRNYSQFGRSP